MMRTEIEGLVFCVHLVVVDVVRYTVRSLRISDKYFLEYLERRPQERENGHSSQHGDCGRERTGP